MLFSTLNGHSSELACPSFEESFQRESNWIKGRAIEPLQRGIVDLRNPSEFPVAEAEQGLAYSIERWDVLEVLKSDAALDAAEKVLVVFIVSCKPCSAAGPAIKATEPGTTTVLWIRPLPQLGVSDLIPQPVATFLQGISREFGEQPMMADAGCSSFLL
jgi:hypothetical protein